MEITIISAQGLKNTTTWPWRLRPFATVSTVPASSSVAAEVHTTSFVDEKKDSGGRRFDRLLPAGFVRQFSYRLRNKDGSRGMHPQRSPLMTYLPEVSKYSPVLGIPVTASSINML
ncbi:hypothetical protein HAX54_032202 [Datura stramonium]|uniref:Uncharacterized protein n=1 Tax=Datura stramonium TaxID=4076 RepID=A0ABS8RLV8_DATST|nr:hypothetical protein [Datura stramonium]